MRVLLARTGQECWFQLVVQVHELTIDIDGFLVEHPGLVLTIAAILHERQ